MHSPVDNRETGVRRRTRFRGWPELHALSYHSGLKERVYWSPWVGTLTGDVKGTATFNLKLAGWDLWKQI